VLGFLFLHPSFPRSSRFCLHEVDNALHRLSETPNANFSNEAERVTGRVASASVSMVRARRSRRAVFHAFR